VGDALIGRTPADVDQPFSQNGFVHQGAPPERTRDHRVMRRDGIDGRARDVDDLTLGDGADVVVHMVEDEDVEVTEVARHQERHDLALAVRKHLVAAGEAIHDKMHVARGVALTDQVRSRRHLSHPGHKRPQCFDFSAAEFLEALKLLKQRILHRTMIVKGNLPTLCALQGRGTQSNDVFSTHRTQTSASERINRICF